MLTIGYARTSTADQDAGLDAQIRDLKAAGCDEVYSEKVSSIGKREQLAQALRHVRKGDTLIVSKPDRLARSTADLLSIWTDLDKRGVDLTVLSMGGRKFDSKNPTDKLMLTLLGAVAEFERGLMLERQREGIAKAKDEGRYKGRAPTARRQADEVQRLRREGVTPTDIGRRLGISRMSVYRYMGEVEKAKAA